MDGWAPASQAGEQRPGQVFVREQDMRRVVLKRRDEKSGLGAVTLSHQFRDDPCLPGRRSKHETDVAFGLLNTSASKTSFMRFL